MSEDKLKIRPVIDSIGSLENKRFEEKFQNITLRPIIKLQHDLLVAYFLNHLGKKNINIDELTEDGKISIISSLFKTDTMFKTELKGLIIGLFTVNEYQDYKSYSGSLNKRMCSMIKERLLSVFL